MTCVMRIKHVSWPTEPPLPATPKPSSSSAPVGRKSVTAPSPTPRPPSSPVPPHPGVAIPTTLLDRNIPNTADRHSSSTSVPVCAYLSLRPSIHPSIHPSILPSKHVYHRHPSIHLCMYIIDMLKCQCLCIHLSIYLFLHPPLHPSIYTRIHRHSQTSVT